MPATANIVIGGVDCHADTHYAIVLDRVSRCLGQAAFPATAAEYWQLTGWLHDFGPVDRVGVESTGAYGAGLARHLDAEGIQVREVDLPHPRTRRRRGKSDASTPRPLPAKPRQARPPSSRTETTGIVEAIRLLRWPVAALSRPMPPRCTRCASRWSPLPSRFPVGLQPTQNPERPRRCLRSAASQSRLPGRSDAGSQADPAGHRRTCPALNQQARALQEQLERLVRRAAPQTTALLGVGVGHAGQLLVTAGQNLDRLHGEAAFAHVCGADPIPASARPTATVSTPAAIATPTPHCT
jgi:transposase